MATQPPPACPLPRVSSLAPLPSTTDRIADNALSSNSHGSRGTKTDSSEKILVLTLHPARRKARAAAEAEVAALLGDFDVRPMADGPRTDVPGTAWLKVRSESDVELGQRLRCLGYSSLVELAEPSKGASQRAGADTVRWRGERYTLRPLYRESAEELQRDSPDRRAFLLECGDGAVRSIVGYRGGRGPLEHRALPVYDARLVVNLAGSAHPGFLLDPFAGAGSIVLFAQRAGWRALALDLDPSLRFGLAELADHSLVGDAGGLPFASRCVDAVVTEPPYDRRALPSVCRAVEEAARVLRPGGALVLFVAEDQADVVVDSGQQAGLIVDLDVKVDRRRMPVRCLRLRPTRG